MYKQDLALNNEQRLICHKNKSNKKSLNLGSRLFAFHYVLMPFGKALIYVLPPTMGK